MRRKHANFCRNRTKRKGHIKMLKNHIKLKTQFQNECLSNSSEFSTFNQRFALTERPFR